MSQMRDSAKSAEWVAKMVAANPITKIINQATGQWDGNIRTCPVRLNFFYNSLHTAVAGKNDDGTPKDDAVFEVTMLFPPCATPQIDELVAPLVLDKMKSAFPGNINPQSGAPFGLKNPLRMQDEQPKYAGYTPGGRMIRATTHYKPPIVDTANNPIVDTARAYPGVWALVSFNLFTYPRPGGKFKGNRGVSAGLQAVMIIADDTPLGGGGVDAKTQFTGVNLDAGFDPSAAFGQAAPPPPPRRSAADLLG